MDPKVAKRPKRRGLGPYSKKPKFFGQNFFLSFLAIFWSFLAGGDRKNDFCEKCILLKLFLLVQAKKKSQPKSQFQKRCFRETPYSEHAVCTHHSLISTLHPQMLWQKWHWHHSTAGTPLNLWSRSLNSQRVNCLILLWFAESWRTSWRGRDRRAPRWSWRGGGHHHLLRILWHQKSQLSKAQPLSPT